MNRMIYFVNKIWNVATDMHPIVYILIFISTTILFFVTKYMILKYIPNTKWLIFKAGIIALIVGPIVFLGVLYVFVLILSKNQPF